MLSLRFSVLLTFALALAACDAPRPDATPTPAAVDDTKAADKPAAEGGEESYLEALQLESAGRYVEAKIAVDQALAEGAGRDAKLLAAKLAILRNDLDTASNLLGPLAAAEPKDALVQYNLGLVAQRRNEYNKARTAYLAAVKADPAYAPARFNLAVLTWDANAKEEAQHHARKFLELAPTDPRAAELRAKVQLEAGPAAPAAPPNLPALPGDPAAVAPPTPTTPPTAPAPAKRPTKQPAAQPAAQPAG
jgi:tetratricopeptide (TPR) repeat protein